MENSKHTHALTTSPHVWKYWKLFVSLVGWPFNSKWSTVSHDHTKSLWLHLMVQIKVYIFNKDSKSFQLNFQVYLNVFVSRALAQCKMYIVYYNSTKQLNILITFPLIECRYENYNNNRIVHISCKCFFFSKLKLSRNNICRKILFYVILIWKLKRNFNNVHKFTFIRSTYSTAKYKENLIQLHKLKPNSNGFWMSLIWRQFISHTNLIKSLFV